MFWTKTFNSKGKTRPVLDRFHDSSKVNALCFMLYASCSMLHALCFMLFALCSVLCALCSVLCVLCSMLYFIQCDKSLEYLIQCPKVWKSWESLSRMGLCSMLYALCSMLAEARGSPWKPAEARLYKAGFVDNF